MALWDKIGSRGNVEDRRSTGSMLALGGGGLSLGGLAVIVLLNYLSGGTTTDILNQLQSGQVATQQIDTKQFEGQDSFEVFASTVLGSTNDMWTNIFAQNNVTYHPPKLVLFRNLTQSGCGGASAEVGPHYCPTDDTIYLDETFFEELRTRFKAKGGDVAEAYVIAHEVGHHAQKQLGIMDEVNKQAESDSSLTNELSVKQELQADCFAGLWAYSIKDKGIFEPNEINEALDAASSIGDDRIQKSTEGRITPENWTHGSSEQRVRWFTTGYNSGSLAQCNTFGS